MEQIPLASGLCKEIVTARMMLYKSTKIKIDSPNGDTDFFDIVSGVLQGHTLAPYLLIIYQDYILQMSIDLMKENRFYKKNEKKQMIPCSNY